MSHDLRATILAALYEYERALTEAKTVNAALLVHHELSDLWYRVTDLQSRALDKADALCGEPDAIDQVTR